MSLTHFSERKVSNTYKVVQNNKKKEIENKVDHSFDLLYNKQFRRSLFEPENVVNICILILPTKLSSSTEKFSSSNQHFPVLDAKANFLKDFV